ncbi:MAG TPA: DegT/DnrJ/EryC1/StrS family aminotransferase [Chitinophagaceae bacterium]|nr:DegT/DnrJ/EryC1/StrS family aminotransferase [Chitinophagaceae bacterium]
MKIEFYRHNLSQEDKEECMKVLDSLFLTTGESVKKFESQFAQYMGAKYAVGLTSCTAALHLALQYFNIGEGDEVITTPMTFIATANTIEYCGARPVFVDVEPDTGNMDAALIEKAITPRTKAIIPIHLYGQLCDMKRIREIADKHHLKIIEDAAHCIEGARDGVKPGQLSDMACYSFYATKNLTCGEGGAITCNDPAIYEWLMKARQHGMSKSAADRYSVRYQHYDMEFLGWKYNLSNIAASLMVHQIGRLDNYLEQKEKIAVQYNNGFKNNAGIQVPAVLRGTVHARHLYTIWVDPACRDKYIQEMQEAGIGIAVNFRSLHRMSFYTKKYCYKAGDFPACEKIADSTITLPFYTRLTAEEIKYIIDKVNQIVS